jgi:leucyl-tRNA synthetase
VTLPVQVNGKLRGTITVPLDAAEAQVRAAALELENVRRFLPDPGTVKRFVYVKNRMVSFVA